MRIVIDMQGAQTESRFRGIGRYTVSFAQGVVRNRAEHEVFLALSGLFPDTIEPIRAAFDGLLPQENIRVWHAPGLVKEVQPGNDRQRDVAEVLREAFLASLEPDIVHISSLFEGYGDDAVTSIRRFDTRTTTSVMLYDLIPLLNPDQYLSPNPSYAQYYQRKAAYLRQADCLLAISNFSRQEGVDALGIPDTRVVNISTAIDSSFRAVAISQDTANTLLRKLGITRSFLLYTGGADERKNLPRLIQAYASLQADLRSSHQLVFVGKMPDVEVRRLKHFAQSNGLALDELLFSGYISDEELIQLYNLCRLFVFPSWHEGFGLPALEAMACGAPVIGANASSLPEVIGLDEALFDPSNVAAMAAKMTQALTDDAFRTHLCQHGISQAKRFSWDKTAQHAIAAWEKLSHVTQTDYLTHSTDEKRLLTALSGPLCAATNDSVLQVAELLALNQQSGIKRQLLVDISELSQRDSATGIQRVVRSYLKWLIQTPPKGFRVEPVYARQYAGYCYARRYTQNFLDRNASEATDDPIRWQRGDIFFGLDMQHHIQLAHRSFYQQMQQDGVTVKFLIYDLLPIQLADLFKDADASQLHARWLAMIATLDGAISISNATASAFRKWMSDTVISPSPAFQNDWVHLGADIASSKPSAGLPNEAEEVLQAIQARLTFLCVSTLEPRKGQQQILEAIELIWQEGVDVNLVFVGQKGWKIDDLAKNITKHPELGRRLFWLKGISDEYLERVYAASTCLIAASLNEGFGLSLIEAAGHGIPIIARDIPVFREVAGDYAYFFSGNNSVDLSQALKNWLELYKSRQNPDSSQIRWSTWQESTEKLKAALISKCYARKQLLVDISELVVHDAKTGIQRVVRSLLREWLLSPPVGFRIEPVYAKVTEPYRYARRFTARFLGIDEDWRSDEIIDYAAGDIFFGLDLQPQVQIAKKEFYQHLRRQGVSVKFMVYDLLSILQPEHFVTGTAEGYLNWLKVVGESDGAICISKAVADELSAWMAGREWARRRNFSIHWSHLGADIVDSTSSEMKTENSEQTFNSLRQRLNFLMVGTLEPRKGHTQVLDAFEQLWTENNEINLVIVGKPGWLTEGLIERLGVHPELGQHLFWLDGISDEYLERVYALSTCLIAASFGEGFGLPLIEAAHHKLPIIARDLPVFREVAGEHAYYFNTCSPIDLSMTIKSWITLYTQNQHPQSEHMHWLTWNESAKRAIQIIVATDN